MMSVFVLYYCIFLIVKDKFLEYRPDFLLKMLVISSHLELRRMILSFPGRSYFGNKLVVNSNGIDSEEHP